MLFVVGGGLFGFLILIEIAGFYAAILAFMIYYVRFLGRHSWWATLSIAFGFSYRMLFLFRHCDAHCPSKGVFRASVHSLVRHFSIVTARNN